MKSRVIWFLFFYIILGLFLAYDLINLGIIWSNKKLLDLYNTGFTISGKGKDLFFYTNAFAVYGLPTIGTLLTFFAIVAAVLSQSFILKISTPKSKLIALFTSFFVLLLGFSFDFIGKLFYDEWSDNLVMISKNGENPHPASYYYYSWLSFSMIWVFFAIFAVLAFICGFIIMKLYYLNIEWLKYDKKESNENLNLEITAPFVSNLEFDPNETQIITLVLEDENNSAWQINKKKDRIKKNKIKKKK